MEDDDIAKTVTIRQAKRIAWYSRPYRQWNARLQLAVRHYRIKSYILVKMIVSALDND
jgi:hypothetical protein